MESVVRRWNLLSALESYTVIQELVERAIYRRWRVEKTIYRSECYLRRKM